jgi:hypothetical protein
MRIAIAAVLLSVVLGAPARAASPALPAEGTTTYSEYFTCRPLSRIDMGELGSRSVAECVGIAKDRGEAKAFDNLSARCVEQEETRGGSARYDGWCVQTDGDGDQFFTTYQGTESGKVTFIGGAGKFKGMSGGGDWTVLDAPAPSPGMFAFTLEYNVSWRRP